MEGKVVSFLVDKRYGFIDGEDGNSYFVHQNEIHGKTGLVPGQTVTFDPIPTPKGYAAKKVNPGTRPERIFSNPDKFVFSRKSSVPKLEVVKKIVERLI